MALADYIISEQQGEDIKTSLDTIATNTSSLGGRSEDTAHISGDSGAGMLAVRQDTLTSSVNLDGDYGFLKIDGSGALYVNVAAGSASATEFNEDSPHTPGDSGIQLLAVRQDILSSSVDSVGDYGHLKVNSVGRLYTSATIDAALPAGTNNIGDVDVASLPGTVEADITATKTAVETVAAAVSTEVQVDIVGVTPDLMLGTDFSNVFSTSNVTTSVDPTAVVNGNPSVRTQAFNLVYNGSTWDAQQGTIADGLLVNLGSNNDVTVTSGDITETNSAAILSDTTGILADTANINTNIATISGAVGGTEIQVDVVAELPAGTQNIGDVDIASIVGTVSTNNSSTSLLGISGVFTGTSDEVTNYAAIVISVISDVASATDGFSVQFSSDGTNWDITESHTVSAGTAHVITIPRLARYFRVVYTNGGTGQASFRLQTVYSATSIGPKTEAISGDIADETMALTSRAVLTAQKPDLSYVNIDATAGGNLKVSMQELSDGIDVGAGNVGSETQRVTIATDDANLSAILVDTGSINTSLNNIETDTGNMDTSLNNIEAGFAAEAAALGSGVLLQGDDGTNRKNINVDPTTGDVQVDVTNTVTVDATGQGDVPITLAGEIVIADVTGQGDVPITLAGETITLATTTNTIEVVGDAAENALASGNPVLIGGRYDLTPRTLGSGDVGAPAISGDAHLLVDIIASLPAGNNNIGNVDIVTLPGTVESDIGNIDTNITAILADTASMDTNIATITSNSTGILADTANIDTNIATIASAVSTEMQVDIVGITPDLMLGTDFSNVMGTASLVLATQADNVANTVDTVQTAAFGYVFDGVTWDRQRGDAVDGTLVNLGTNNDVTVTGSVTETNSASILVDTGAINTATAAIAIDTGNIDTSLNAIEAAIAVEGAALGSGVLIQGDDGLDRTNILVDSSGRLQVDVISNVVASEYAEDSVHTTTDTGSFVLSVRQDSPTALSGTSGDYQPFITDANGRLHTIEASAASVLADTNTIAAAVSGAEMQVDIVTMPVVTETNSAAILAATTAILADTATMDTNIATLAGAVSGTEVQVDIVASIPAGTNNIGDVDISSITGFVSTNNSTSTPLGISGVFTGSSEDVTDYAAITLYSYSDVAGTCVHEFSSDGTNWDLTESHTVTAGEAHAVSFPVMAQYYRVVYTNGGTGQTAFRLQSMFSAVSIGPKSYHVDGTIDDTTIASTTRAILSAQKPDLSYANIDATTAGNLKISLQEISDGLDIGAGNAGTETARVSISTDDVNLAAINTSTATIAAAVSTEMQVDIVAPLPAGSNNIGDVDILSIAAGDNNIGNVDIVTLPNVTLASTTNTIEIVGDAAENAAVAGNPVLVGGRYDLTPRVLGDGDVGAIALDPDGAAHISDGGNSITVDGTITETNSAAILADTANIDINLGTVTSNSTAILADTANMDINLGTVATNTTSILADTATIDTNIATIASAVATEMQVDIVGITPDLMLGTDFSNVLGTASLITATQADNLVNTTDTINTSAFGYVFDGVTWDRQKGDSTDGTLVNLGTNNDVVETNSASILADTTAILADTAAIDTNIAAILVDTAAMDTNLATIAGAVATEMQVDIVASLPAGTNTIGKLGANSGVDIGDVDVTSFPAEVHITDYDTVGTDNTVTMGIVVPASGGPTPITGDAANGLDVDVTRVSGTVTTTVGSALPAGDNNIGNVDIVTLPGTSEADITAIKTAVEIIDNAIAGSEMQVDIVSGGITQYAEDTVHNTGDSGTMVLAVRNDVLASLASLDGDYAPLQVTASGALYVDETNSAAILADTASMDTNLATIAGDTTSLDGKDLMLGTDFSNVLGTTSLITATQADNLVNTTDGLNTTSMGYVFDGVTWDRQPGNSADGTLVNLGSNNDVTVTSGAITETNSTAILADTANIDTNITTISGAVSAGQMQVDVVAALPAGDNNIGNVDIVTLPASTNTIEIVGDVADNAVAAGNPVLVGGVVNTDGSERTLAGSDASYLAANTYGSAVIDHRDDGRSNKTGSVSTTTSTEIAGAPGVGKAIVLEYLHVQNAAATATEMNILSATTNKFKFRLAAEDGFGITAPVRGLTMAANEALNIKSETTTTYYYFAIWRIVRS